MSECDSGGAERRLSKFSKVLGRWDLIVMALGAMIGWGWVVSSGQWITDGGVIGAALGFVIGGLMVFFVGLTYSELTSAMPECGGEHVFSYKAMGKWGSFVCTWAIILGYASVVCFEACTVPTVLSYLNPDFQQWYLFTVAGYDVYLSCVLIAMAIAVFILYLNIRGTVQAARVQSVLTIVILFIGIMLIAGAAFNGDVSNVTDNMFAGEGSGGILKSIITVAMITPFFFIGFDVIPQTAEEIRIPLKKIGRVMILSIILAVVFYVLVILAIGMIMSQDQIAATMTGTGLTTADAMAAAFNSQTMSNVLIIGGLCGVVTSWNAFLMGGSRAMYSMAESNMIPKCFGRLHRRFNTPYVALILIGALSIVAPLLGRKMLTWAVDAGNFGCCLAYFMVALSFLILRRRAPDMPRPYRVRFGTAAGICALAMSGFMLAMYIIPDTGVTLVWQEWAMVAGWCILGVFMAVLAKRRYGTEFGRHVDLHVEHDE